MRLVVVLFFAIAALTASSGKQINGQRKYKTDDKDFLERQKNILRLFRYINQPNYYKDIAEISNNYSVEGNVEAYSNSQAVKQFLSFYREGILPRGEIFSIFHNQHLEQAIALFKLFYYANDYDTFYKTAVWARNHLNEGLWLYSFSVAIVHRPDTYGIILPPIYEVYPNYFFNSDVIHQVYEIKQKYYGGENKPGRKGFTIYANYSGHYLNLHPEQSLSYFMEDIGINMYYWQFNIYYPFWMNGEEFQLKNDRRGEQFYYFYQQLLARFYLERLSNDFGEIEGFSYEEPIPTGYYPSLRYSNGLDFPSRPNFAKLHEYFYNYGQRASFKSRYSYSYTFVLDFERRIRDAIDEGYIKDNKGHLIDIFTPQGIELLGSAIEGNPESPNPRFYGPIQVFARHLLGYSTQPLDAYHLCPSALEHFETSLRDPIFYQFFKRIVLLFQKYKLYLPPYGYNELVYPGVKIESIEFDRLITFFDYFDADISNAAYIPEKEYDNGFRVRARQYRLNHKPFTYRINVNAEKAGDAVVRVYLGPKYDEYGRLIDLNENRINFVEIDEFRYALQAGENKIERNNRQSWYTADRTSFEELYDRVEEALSKGVEFQVDGTEAYYGFPLRYLLPMGKRGGQEYQVYVIITPYQKPALQQDIENYFYPRVGTGGNYIDSLPFGFPFDRLIDEYTFYKVPNAFFKDVTIYLKEAEDVNASVSSREEP